MNIKRLLIALSMAMGVSSLSAGAYSSFLDGKYVNISAVEFRTAEGIIESLPSSGEIIVSAKVKKAGLSDDNQQVTLVAALYNGNKLERVEQQSVVLNNNYTVQIEKSIDVTGINGVRAFVCSNLEEGCPFGSKAIFAAENTEILGITVAGEKIKDFSADKTEYDITVSAGYMSFPEVTPILSDSGMKCEIETQGFFPLASNQTAKVIIKLGKAAEKTYTINMLQEKAEVTNYSAEGIFANEKEVRNDKKVTLVENLRDVTYITEPTEQIKISANAADGSDMTEGYGYKNFSDSVEFFNERIFPINFLPDEIKKAVMIRTTYDFHKASARKIKFDINRSATVYVSANSSNDLIADGFAIADNIKISWLSFVDQNSTAGRVYIYDAYKKHFDVTPGEIVSVEIPHGAINAFVVFDESEFVRNAVLKPTRGKDRDPVSLPLVEVRNAEYYDWKYPNYREGIENYLYAAKFVSDKANEKYMFSAEFPNELEGAVGIAAPADLRDYNRDTENTEFITFDITESADVYVAYEAEYERMPWMEAMGYEDVSSTVGSVKYVHSADEIIQTTKMYKKSYNVLPGETVKVNIGGFPSKDSHAPLMIFVKKQVTE